MATQMTRVNKTPAEPINVPAMIAAAESAAKNGATVEITVKVSPRDTTNVDARDSDAAPKPLAPSRSIWNTKLGRLGRGALGAAAVLVGLAGLAAAGLSGLGWWADGFHLALLPRGLDYFPASGAQALQNALIGAAVAVGAGAPGAKLLSGAITGPK